MSEKQLKNKEEKKKEKKLKLFYLIKETGQLLN